MSLLSLTSRRLADLQPAVFEQLASAILQTHSPFESLIPVGINDKGRPVPAPVDAICWLPRTNPPQGVLFAYTAINRGKLREKWLYDPTQTSRRKAKPPEGDVVKALHRAEEIRREIPDAVLTLVLACTVDPDDALVTAVKALCRNANVEVDFWTAFRFVQFLDSNPHGQWLRQEFLKIPARSISWSLLRDLSEKSLHSYGAFIFENTTEPRIERELDRRLWEEACRAGGGVRFLIAESGLGKSSAALALLRRHMAAGGCSLWLRPEDVALGGSVEVAVEAVLRQLQPELQAGCGAEALKAASGGPGLFLVVDDLSRYATPANLLVQIASWEGRPKSDEARSRDESRGWFVLCPIWPRFLSQLPDTSRENVDTLCLQGGTYTPEEGAAVLRARARHQGGSLTEIEARRASELLGHDPLLLRLLDFGGGDFGEGKGDQPVTLKVIDGFLERCRSRLADQERGFMASDYEDALLSLADKMLTEREWAPTWRQIRSWFSSSPDNLEALKQICADRQISHLLQESREEVLHFRHDRVRDAVLAAALVGSMKNGTFEEEILGEPFYAELLGQAVLSPDVDQIWVSRLREHNPLALLRAFQLFQTPHSPFQEAIVTALKGWLTEEVATDRALDALRWEAVELLAKTDSPLVLELGRSFPDTWPGVQEALFRNGDVAAAVSYCAHMWLGVPYSGFVPLQEHVQAKFGRSFANELATTLNQSGLDKTQLRGALVLAGHLAEPALAPTIRSTWERAVEHRMPLFAEFLWAALRCLPEPEDEADSLIDPICEAWRALPNESLDQTRAPENTEVIRPLQDAVFRRGLGRHAVAALIRRAIGRLEWPITILCRHIDAPDAVEFTVRAAAISGSWHFTSAWEHWDFHGRHLGADSIDRLEALWKTPTEGEEIRKRAFHFWSIAAEASGLLAFDLLRTVGSSEPFYSNALRYRIKRGDQTATAELIRMTETDEFPHYWWQYAHRIWSETLRDALDSFLGRLPEDGRAGDWEWEGHHFCAAEALIEIPAADAEALLLRHWEHLRHRSIFVQAALAVATPRCLERVAETVRDCPDPRRLLKHFEYHCGLRVVGRGQQFGRRQLETILPYLDLFSENTLEDLWLYCNEQGWFAYRRQHLDPRLTTEQRKRFWLEREGLFEELDRYLGEKQSPWSIDFDIKRSQDHGETWADFLEGLLAWLRERRTLRALDAVAHALVWAGRRTDLALLGGLEIEGDPAEVRKILDRTAFQLFRRRLR